MEIASTAIGVIGLASLFSTCIETLDTLSSAARYGVDREILQTKVEIERLRLMVWGESVGITEIDPECTENEITEDDLAILDDSIRSPALRPAIIGLLSCFTHYFENIEELQRRYGLAARQETKGKEKDLAWTEKPTREILLSSFQKTYSRFQERTAIAQKNTSAFKKATWAISDERKFRALLAEIKAINDSLVSLLPAIGDRTRVQMRADIMQSKNITQLQNIVSAADDMTDLVAETASLRLEMLSTSSQHGGKRQIPQVQNVTPAPKDTPETRPVNSAALTPASGSVVENLITATLDNPQNPNVRTVSPRDLYDDTGALFIHKAYYKPNCLRYFSWVVGLDEITDTSELQPGSDSAFCNIYPLPLSWKIAF
ncbi:hypothetical protein N7462_003508 [Penicillium macrosclerotiorum]|uniref:uncharacterized protein n=1 Tax=Penicillium macrosclerotiorum TaxID=303699 RepID=UPI002548C9AC|nr:uncharacterized protein N7462_003508 [Penicillium macrosclerotiorum]KAJ5689116.1 hypothetical protein N7462_003508 [Penicillium macrosclerotiorum]